MLRRRLSPTRLHESLLKRRFRRSGLKECLVETPNGELSYWLGDRDGPPLVLLHGFGASALWQWHPQVAALAKKHRLIIPDLLFFGRSTTATPGRSITHQAEAVCALLDDLSIDQADFLGMSYGGFVTYTLATKFPDRIRRMILVGCPGDEITKVDHHASLETLGVQHITELLLPEEPKDLRRLMAVAWHKPPWIPLPLLRDAHRVLMNQQLEGKRELLLDLLDYLEGERSQTPRHPPQAPTLLIWGEHDAIFPLSLAKRLQRKLGDLCQLEVLRNAAHAPNLEHKRRFNRAVLQFLGAP